MNEYRYDPTADRWAIIAASRTQRPHEFARRSRERVSQICPFCAGQEAQTPRAVEIFGNQGERPSSPPADDASGDDAPWTVRVVDNKYPAVVPAPHETIDPDTGRSSSCAPTCAFSTGDTDSSLEAGPLPQACYPASGIHEVIIESPRHATSFADVDPQVARMTFLAYRNRMRAASMQPRVRYAQVFKNEGPDAGASMEHPHSQLLGTPFVPREIQIERSCFARWFDEQGECVLCDLLRRAEADGRFVLEQSGVVAFCPFASRFPYEVWIAPRRHQGRFDEVETSTAYATGQLTQIIVDRLRRILDRPPYNLWIHTDPFDTQGERHYHWHIEIAPRYNPTAGYEFAGGAFINPVAPEMAAEQLRAINQSTDALGNG